MAAREWPATARKGLAWPRRRRRAAVDAAFVAVRSAAAIRREPAADTARSGRGLSSLRVELHLLLPTGEVLGALRATFGLVFEALFQVGECDARDLVGLRLEGLGLRGGGGVAGVSDDVPGRLGWGRRHHFTFCSSSEAKRGRTPVASSSAASCLRNVRIQSSSASLR